MIIKTTEWMLLEFVGSIDDCNVATIESDVAVGDKK
jgi:hypothetical protein